MIRARRDEDLERAAVALRSVYLSDGYPTNWPKDPARWIAGRRVIGAWVCERGEQVVGHVALTAADPGRAFRQWSEALTLPVESLAVVSRFFVTPGERERGVGARLISRVERAAADRGLHLVLAVSDHNRAAISFYEKRRWRRVGRGTLPPGDEGRTVHLLLFVAPRE
jgi:GNAT superfamily N-acetyltransferase